jgi:tripartite-type tricarboxylate transporter receptor subunit TctC
MKKLTALFAALLLASASQAFAAETYPDRPIRLIVPYPPGASSNDILGRALAQRMTTGLGQQVVVDNRSGASGTLGSEIAAKSTPDGYTLLIGVASPLALGPSVYKLGFDPVKDLAPIARFALIPYVMAVHPSVPAKNIPEFIAYVKARPGKVNFGSSGNGGSPHLCSELFKLRTGTDMVHVPYKGGAQAMLDVLSGQVPMICTGATALTGHIQSGRLRALGVATLQRSAQLPSLPTIAEQGVKGFDVSSWSGLMAPAGTPKPIIDKLYKEVARIVATDDMKKFMLGNGAEPALMSPQEFGKYIKAEIEVWGKVVKAANIRID